MNLRGDAGGDEDLVELAQPPDFTLPDGHRIVEASLFETPPLLPKPGMFRECHKRRTAFGARVDVSKVVARAVGAYLEPASLLLEPHVLLVGDEGGTAGGAPLLAWRITA